MKKAFVFIVAIGLAASAAAFPLSLEQAASIRDEVGLMCDWGSPSAQIGMGIFTDDWESINQLLDEDRHAMMCQGCAYALHMLYESLGYRSYLVGFKSTVRSHAVCVVEIENRLVVMDPTFNVTFVDPETGEPLSVFDVMEGAYFHDRVPMVVDAGQPVVVNYIQMKSDPISPSYLWKSDNALVSTNDYDIYEATITMARFEKHISEELEEYAGAKSLPPTAVTAFYTGEPIYVFKTYPMTADEEAEANELHQTLTAHYKRLSRE